MIFGLWLEAGAVSPYRELARHGRPLARLGRSCGTATGTGSAMTMKPGWVPPGMDVGKANGARVYDWWLGGDHNFRADQDAARAMIAVEPNARAIARANRAFLGRAVRFLAVEAGIRQFLDIGSGIPTQSNVHQVAQDAASGTRVVYADVDDVAVAHSKLILDGSADAAVIQADLRDPASILADPKTQLLLDFTRPIALLLWRCCTSSPMPTTRSSSSPPCATRSPPAATSSSRMRAATPGLTCCPRSRPSTRTR